MHVARPAAPEGEHRRRGAEAVRASGVGPILALVVLLAGMLAVLQVGGALGDIAGLAAVGLALVAFCRAVFRLAAGDGGDDGEAEPPRLP